MSSSKQIARILILIHVGFLVSPIPAAQNPNELEVVEPESVGMDSGKLKRIDSIVNQGIADAKMPGCVVAVGSGL